MIPVEKCNLLKLWLHPLKIVSIKVRVLCQEKDQVTRLGLFQFYSVL